MLLLFYGICSCSIHCIYFVQYQWVSYFLVLAFSLHIFTPKIIVQGGIYPFRMALELAELLRHSLDSRMEEHATQSIEHIRDSDRTLFLKNLYEIIVNNSCSISVREASMIHIWKEFPEDISDIKENDEGSIEKYDAELVMRILDFAFQTMTNPDEKLSYYSSTLYARVSSVFMAICSPLAIY